MIGNRYKFAWIAMVAATVAALSILPVRGSKLPGSTVPAATGSRIEPRSSESMRLNQILVPMRELHQRVLSAESADARRALLPESARLMRDGLAMMREMKEELPTTASGEFVSDTITQAEAQRVQDFLALMEWLVQTRDDQESARQSAPQGLTGRGVASSRTLL